MAYKKLIDSGDIKIKQVTVYKRDKVTIVEYEAEDGIRAKLKEVSKEWQSSAARAGKRSG